MKQTALKWFYDQLIEYPLGDWEYFLKQAKQMEKEQHGNTWDAAIQAHEERGGVTPRSLCDFDEYYNKTYGERNE
jgi:hypothetical protein